jgi:hypothetical protein
MLVLLKAQNCQMFKRKEPMLALHAVQGHPSTQRSIYANKKKSEDQSVVAHFMLADCKSHYSGITCAEKRVHVRAAAYEVHACDVMW